MSRRKHRSKGASNASVNRKANPRVKREDKRPVRNRTLMDRLRASERTFKTLYGLTKAAVWVYEKHDVILQFLQQMF